MATAAFRSRTRRSDIGGTAAADDAVSSTRGGAGDRIHRARSLSRGPARFRPGMKEEEEDIAGFPGGRFVRKARGSEFPETSLDDLADEFFLSRYDDEDDSRARVWKKEDEKARRRGRSVVSRGRDRRGKLEGEEGAPANRVEKKGSFEKKYVDNGIYEGNLRRRRSLSVARYRCSDSESDVDLSRGNRRNFSNGKIHQTSTKIPAASNHTLRRSLSQKDLLQSQSHSALTDDEAKDVHPNTIGPEKMIWAVNAQKKSDERKQELLAALAAEEQRSQQLTKIVKELLPEPKQTAVTERPSQSRRRSNDKKRMSRCLTDEAEKYFTDFLMNIEDTDISSFDGERSDTSSTVGGARQSQQLRMHYTTAEDCIDLDKPSTQPVEANDLVLPWLQWETNNGSSPSLIESKTPKPVVAGKNFFISAQEDIDAYNSSNHPTSSRGSWSPEFNGHSPAVSRYIKGSNTSGYFSSKYSGGGRRRGSSFNMDEYLHLNHQEDLLFERLRQRNRIESGSLVLLYAVDFGSVFVVYLDRHN